MDEDKADDKDAVELKPKLHDDADFMAAIDEQMEAIKTRKKKPKKAAEPAEPKEETQKEVAEEPKAAEPAEKAKPSDDGEVIAVTTTPTKEEKVEEPDRKALSHSGKTIQPVTLTDVKKAEPTKAEVKEDDGGYEGDGTSVKVNVDNTAEAEEVVEEKPKEEDVKEEPKVEEKKDEEKPKTEEKPEEKKPEPKKTSREKPTLETSELSAQIGGKKDEQETEEDDDGAHELKTFDTKQYHLPIKPTRHHRKHAVHPFTVFILLLFLVVAVGVAAIDMELLDIGISLPFDWL